MSNLVIVAIPDENDRVWKVSSEEIPHMTLLFLGEADEVANLQQIIEFTEHAANTTLRRFWLPVDRRAELGEDKADVLFFKKGRYDYKAIRDFRVQLLKDDNIRTAYDSSPQHEGVWQPHLTLGYPGKPAKPDETDRDYGFYDVQFNKIAVWPEDYNGPEFLLKDYWDEYEALESVPMDVAMSSVNQARIALGLDAVENIEHYGVRGMRWGVRKEDVENAAKSGTSAVAKAVADVNRFAGDVQFEARTAPRTDSETGAEKDSKARELVIGAAHKDFKAKDLSAINAKPEYEKTRKLHNRLLKPFDKTTKAYRAEVKAAYIQRLETTANAMKNPSGTREYSIRERGGDLPKSKYYWEVSTREARHAAGDDFTLVEVLTDDDGFITGTKVVKAESTMAQTADLGADFLAHYGVKGMKWGVRNERGGSNTSSVGEKKREGIQRFLDPQGNDLGTDIVKSVLWPMVPPLGLFAIPSDIRLARAGARGVKAKVIDANEKHFEKKAQSAKNFVAIHNGSGERVNRELETINKKYPKPNVDAATQAKYDKEVLTMMQKAYKESANSLTNKFNTRHLDVEFKGDGMDVKISAKEGPGTPLPQRVKHADEDEDEVFTFHAKFKRDTEGHIVGMEFEDFEKPEVPKEMAQSAIIMGSQLVLEHYGVKGMRWGVRRNRETPSAVDAMATSRVPHGAKRKTKIDTEGGENHPAADDAIKVAKSRVKLAKSGTAALSNQELREVANRLQLEQQVKQLTAPAGKKFVTNLLRSETQQGGQMLFRKGVKKGGKGVRKVALGF